MKVNSTNVTDDFLETVSELFAFDIDLGVPVHAFTVKMTPDLKYITVESGILCPLCRIL